jgi:ABC-type taurine transport system ATPase subunit
MLGPRDAVLSFFDGVAEDGAAEGATVFLLTDDIDKCALFAGELLVIAQPGFRIVWPESAA